MGMRLQIETDQQEANKGAIYFELQNQTVSNKPGIAGNKHKDNAFVIGNKQTEELRKNE